MAFMNLNPNIDFPLVILRVLLIKSTVRSIFLLIFLSLLTDV